MRILTIHNKYKIRGGEDEAREAEAALLASYGHEIRELVFDNEIIGVAQAAKAGLLSGWRHESYRRVLAAIDTCRPDVVSVHNFFPLATPAVHYAARQRGVPVVQTLHNFRLLCPGAAFFRDGAVCEECLGRAVPWPGVRHQCYRRNAAASAAVSWMITLHRMLRTWKKRVAVFVALTEFNRQKFIQGGLPAEKIFVKQNFVPMDLGAGPGDGDYVLYVGRLSPEKGVLPLLAAWKRVKSSGRLLIAGDGPLQSVVAEAARHEPSVEYLGRTPLRRVYELMGSARALVFPSLWYEGMPRVIIESLCRGAPVIASRLGSMEELIAEGRTGWFVKPGDAGSIARALNRALDPLTDMAQMRSAARAEYEARYTPEQNVRLLEDIYLRAIESVRSQRSAA